VLALVRTGNDPAPLIAEGSWQGRIALAPAGTGGFGYDPWFIPDGHVVTSAQLAPDVKNALSHRGQALRALVARLPAWR
jgi:XTP/dITP diphosphohydrolase